MIPIRDCLPRKYPPFISWLLIFINIIVFIFELSLPEELLEKFFYIFGVVPAKYMLADSLELNPISYLPFFTSMFLHGGWLHLISNMWTIVIFADNVEDKMGHINFLIFYILSGLAAGIIHCIFNPTSTIPTIGASGAISGILGAYMFLFPHSRVITLIPIFFIPYFIALPAFTYIFIWFFSQIFSGIGSLIAQNHIGGVAWWAHIGGFIFGVITHRIFIKRKRLYYEDDDFEYYCAWNKW